MNFKELNSAQTVAITWKGSGSLTGSKKRKFLFFLGGIFLIFFFQGETLEDGVDATPRRLDAVDGAAAVS